MLNALAVLASRRLAFATASSRPRTLTIASPTCIFRTSITPYRKNVDVICILHTLLYSIAISTAAMAPTRNGDQTTPHLPSLPQELIDMVLKDIQRPSHILNLGKTCRSLYPMIAPKLYHKVDLDLRTGELMTSRRTVNQVYGMLDNVTRRALKISHLHFRLPDEGEYTDMHASEDESVSLARRATVEALLFEIARRLPQDTLETITFATNTTYRAAAYRTLLQRQQRLRTLSSGYLGLSSPPNEQSHFTLMNVELLTVLTVRLHGLNTSLQAIGEIISRTSNLRILEIDGCPMNVSGSDRPSRSVDDLARSSREMLSRLFLYPPGRIHIPLQGLQNLSVLNFRGLSFRLCAHIIVGAINFTRLQTLVFERCAHADEVFSQLHGNKHKWPVDLRNLLVTAPSEENDQTRFRFRCSLYYFLANIRAMKSFVHVDSRAPYNLLHRMRHLNEQMLTLTRLFLDFGAVDGTFWSELVAAFQVSHSALQELGLIVPTFTMQDKTGGYDEFLVRVPYERTK